MLSLILILKMLFKYCVYSNYRYNVYNFLKANTNCCTHTHTHTHTHTSHTYTHTHTVKLVTQTHTMYTCT